MNKPNLFLVGEPKSGTTALYYFLRMHPEIKMSNPKEPDYFCTDLHKQSDEFHGKRRYFPIRTEKQYLSLFSGEPKKVMGEGSVNYMYSKVAAKNIFKFNPDAKIIIMLREPVEFLESLHSQEIFSANENIMDFKIALAMEDVRRKGQRIPPMIRYPSKTYYSERVRYSEHVKRFTDLFGKNVRVILFDDFKENNEGVFREVLKFLKVSRRFVPEFKVHNPNKRIRFRRFRLLIESPVVWSVPKAVLPRKVYAWIRKGFYKSTTKYEIRKQLDPGFRRVLMRKCKKEVVKISKLLKKDLVKKWGYGQI